MIVSIDWIKEHIDTSISLEELEDKLTALGLECTLEKQIYPFFVKRIIPNIMKSDSYYYCDILKDLTFFNTLVIQTQKL